MSDQATLAILLDGPLQSWGVDSRYQQRDTAAFPTKSGIIGLLAAALGIDKHAPNEATLLAPYVALRLTVLRSPSGVPKRSGRLTDFHTVGGGYDSAAGWQRLSISRRATGGPADTVITRRSYLTDSAFVALLEGDRTVLATAADALSDPCWGLWFGRKACIPAAPLAPTIEATPQAAFDALRRRFGLAPCPLESFDRQVEKLPAEMASDAFYQPDQPKSFGNRSFVSRPIRYIRGSIPGSDAVQRMLDAV
jgi:CRISPR system Cascade subunit CasD